MYQEDHQGGKGGCRTERIFLHLEQSPEQVGFHSRVSSCQTSLRTRLNHLRAVASFAALSQPPLEFQIQKVYLDSVGPIVRHGFIGDASFWEPHHHGNLCSIYTAGGTPRCGPQRQHQGRPERLGSWGQLPVGCWVGAGSTAIPLFEGTKCVVVFQGLGSSIMPSSYLLVI